MFDVLVDDVVVACALLYRVSASCHLPLSSLVSSAAAAVPQRVVSFGSN